MTNDAEIRPAESSELKLIVDLLGAAGFRDHRTRPQTIRFAHDSDRGKVVVAEYRGTIVGVALGLALNATGWVSAVGVDANSRRRGIATNLTLEVVEWLRGQGAATISLNATEEGHPVYEQLGFVDEGEFVIHAGPPLSTDTALPAGVRELVDSDRDFVLDIDRSATGEKRDLLIEAAWPRGGFVYDNAGTRTGYNLRCDWGAGPIVAHEQSVGTALIDAARSGTDEETVIFASSADNSQYLSALEERGFHEALRVMRMRLGPQIPWRASALYGSFNMYWG